jgi:PAS domain S-box-containing protein
MPGSHHIRPVSTKKRRNTFANQQRVTALLGIRALSGIPPHDLFQEAVEQIVAALQVEMCYLVEILPNSQSCIVRAETGWPQEYADAELISLGLHSQLGYALLQNSPVIVEDIRTETRFEIPDILSQRGVISGMSVIIYQDNVKPWGMISVHTTAHRQFTVEDTEFVLNVANILGLFLQRQHTDEAYKASETRARMAMEAAKIGSWHWDLQTDTFTCSPLSRQLLGIPMDAPMSYSLFLDCLHPDDRDTDDAFVQQCIRDKTPCDGECRIVWPDGTLHWIRSKGTPYYAADGTPLRMEGVFYDVTAHKLTERIREEALSKAQEFQRLFDISWDLVSIAGFDGYFKSINPAWSRALGYSEQELLSSPFISFVHPDDVEATLAEAAKLSADATVTIAFDNRYRCQDGTYRWLSWNAVSEPTTQRLYCVARDVTDRKHAEQALHESQQFIQQIADSFPSILYLYDLKERHIVYSNREIANMLGYPPEVIQVMGAMFLSNLVHPEDLGHVMAHHQKLGETTDQSILELEYRMQHADGTYRWLYSRDTVFLRLPDGTPKQILGTAQDITQRRMMQQSLKQSETRFQAFMDSGSFFAWMTDVEGKIYYINAPFGRLFNVEPTAMIGKSSYDLFDAKEAAIHVANNRKVLETGQILETVESATLPDGTQSHVLVHKFPVEDGANGVLIGGIGIDITERKSLEDQFQQAQKMEGIGRLAGGIAHDFNNLLGIILGYAELIDEELPDDSPLHANIRTMADAASRASNLTGQLLSFARRQTTKPKIISPNTHIRDLTEMLRPIIGEDIILQTRLDGSAGMVRIDPHQLEQVVVNLVVNARDAMVQGGVLTIQTAEEVVVKSRVYPQFVRPVGQYIRLSVSDTGEGMTEDVKSRLFEPFFTTKEIGKGTGLGLASVYGIIKQNDGFVLVESAIGQGATFHLFLPKVDPEVNPVPEMNAQPLSSAGTETILIVEDEPILRELATLTLRKNGYTVLEAGNGVDALQVAVEYSGEIDLLVTDAVMPQMGGKELAERLRRTRPKIRVLLASGYAEDRYVGNQALLQNAAFLPKPFTPRALTDKVREVLWSS